MPSRRVRISSWPTELVERALSAEGVELIGPGGLLTGLTRTVLETVVEAEISDHLGYDRHDPMGRNRGNSRNGTRAKTVLTEVSPVQIEVPRHRDGTFEPAIVRERDRGGHSDDRVDQLTGPKRRAPWSYGMAR